jgi:hypothetical protein
MIATFTNRCPVNRVRRKPTEKGLQITHGWPIPGQSEVDALLRLLDAMIASPETSGEERSRLQRLRDAAGEVSQSVLSGLLGRLAVAGCGSRRRIARPGTYFAPGARTQARGPYG